MSTYLQIHSLLGATPQSDFELAEIVEKGLPTGSISYLRDVGLAISEVSAVVISPRTLKHRKTLSREEKSAFSASPTSSPSPNRSSPTTRKLSYGCACPTTV
jgi:hypothetical protein